MNRCKQFRNSLKTNQDIYDIKDVEKYMTKSEEELIAIPLITLNRLCSVCEMCKGQNSTTCPIGRAVHVKDKDDIDIKNMEKYSNYYPEL